MGLIGKLKLATSKPASAAPAAAPVMPVQPVKAQPIFNASRFKMKLKQAKIRSEVHKVKAQNVKVRTRDTVVEELRNNRSATAYIRMEQLLRDTASAEAFDVFEVYVELLVMRNTVIETTTDFSALGSDVREAIASIAFASTRMNIVELREVVDMLRGFYGPGVIDPLSRCEGPDAGLVNSLLAQKLDGTAPDDYDILEGLTVLAREENLNWTPPAEPENLKGSLFGPPGPSVAPAFALPFVAQNIPAPSAPYAPGSVPIFQPGGLGGPPPPGYPGSEFPCATGYPPSSMPPGGWPSPGAGPYGHGPGPYGGGAPP